MFEFKFKFDSVSLNGRWLAACFRRPRSLFCAGDVVINYTEQTRVNVRPTYANSFISR